MLEKTNNSAPLNWFDKKCQVKKNYRKDRSVSSVTLTNHFEIWGEICEKTICYWSKSMKIPTDETLWPKNDWWTDRKGSYEVTFDMLENEMLGGIKLKIKLES